jgi:hypothetical protein
MAHSLVGGDCGGRLPWPTDRLGPGVCSPQVLGHVQCPVLLLVGGSDHDVLELNR